MRCMTLDSDSFGGINKNICSHVLGPANLARYGPHFCASLYDNFPDPLTHRTLQNLVAIFLDQHDVKSVVKLRVRRRRMTHDFLS